jgi:hypothetical protein
MAAEAIAGHNPSAATVPRRMDRIARSPLKIYVLNITGSQLRQQKNDFIG